jgi:hypothetical protein
MRDDLGPRRVSRPQLVRAVTPPELGGDVDPWAPRVTSSWCSWVLRRTQGLPRPDACPDPAFAASVVRGRSRPADKIFFTTYHGSTRRVVAVLDSDGNLAIAGHLTTDQKYLTN